MRSCSFDYTDLIFFFFIFFSSQGSTEVKETVTGIVVSGDSAIFQLSNSYGDDVEEEILVVPIVLEETLDSPEEYICGNEFGVFG